MDSTPGPSRNFRKRKRKSSQNKQNLHSLYKNESESDLSASSSDYKSDSESEGDRCIESSVQETQEGNPNTEISWSSNSSSMQIIPFTKEQKLLVPLPSPCDPLKFFEMFLTNEFLTDTVTYTNEYGQYLLHQEVKESSRIKAWKDLTVEELKTFIALLLHTGTIQLPKLNDYWKTHWLFNLRCFSNYMSRNRFLLILRCLHFTSINAQSTEPNNRLYKIRHVLDHFNNTMRNIYYPGKELLLDESMILRKGRLIFCQLNKNKHHKCGSKFYILTEPDGTIIKFESYTGTDDETSGIGHTEKIILKLLQDKLQSGHSIYINNFYNSYGLAIKLLGHNTYCTGILNKAQKGNPKDLISAVLEKGENRSLFCNGVHIGKFHDKQDIFYITTEFSDNMIETQNKQNIVKQKPEAIVNYNKYMSNIDRQDQMMAYYPCSRKTFRWYKKLFVHILQMSLLNSFYLYNKFCNKKYNFYDFKMQVLEMLLPKKETLKNFNSKHRLSKIENTKQDTKKNKTVTMRKQCKMCRIRNVRKDTVYQCKVCVGEPGFCIECFFDFHDKQ